VAGPGAGAGVAKPAGLETLDPGLDTGRVAAGPGVIVFIPGIGVKFGSGSEPWTTVGFPEYFTGLLIESMMLGT